MNSDVMSPASSLPVSKSQQQHRSVRSSQHNAAGGRRTGANNAVVSPDPNSYDSEYDEEEDEEYESEEESESTPKQRK